MLDLSGAALVFDRFLPTIAPLLSPGAGWTGVPGSGFAGGPPVDPVRVTAKPTLFELTANYQAFAEDFLLAFDGDSWSGIDRVRIWCEGRSVEVPRAYHGFTKPDGLSGLYIGFAARLDHAACMAVIEDGAVEVYAEAIPNDPLMQSRVIGPFRFYPRRPGTGRRLRWEADYTVGPGGTHATIAAAINMARGLAEDEAIRITLLEGGTYEVGRAGSTSLPRRAWTRIQGSPGQPAVIHSPATADAIDQYRPVIHTLVDGVEFYGPDLHYDLGRGAWATEADWTCGQRINGCRVGQLLGRYDLGVSRDMAGIGAGAAPLYIESAEVREVNVFTTRARLICNTSIRGICGDVTQNNQCMHNVAVSDMGYGALRSGTAAMTLAYTGSGVATVEISGTTQPGQSRVMTVRVDGAVVGAPWAILHGNGIQHDDVSAAVAYINALGPGWSATLLDNRWRAAHLCAANGPTEAMPPTPVPAGGLTLTARMDVHLDLAQFYGNALQGGQAHMAFVTGREIHAGQMLFVMASSTVADITFLCIDLDGDGVTGQSSQMSADTSAEGYRTHHSVRNCTILAQSLFERPGTPDRWPATGRCGVRNSVFGTLNRVPNTPTNFVMDRNHGFAAVSSNSTNSSTGGSAETEFPGRAGGNLSPLPGGRLMNADGSYRGARWPDGRWNH